MKHRCQSEQVRDALQHEKTVQERNPPQRSGEAKIRQEAFNEGLAKGRMREPTQGAPEETSPLYLGKPKPETSKDERTLMTDFMQGLETPAAAVTH